MRYHVEWSMIVEAKSPWEAGLQAKLAQLDNAAIASHFIVTDEQANPHIVHVSGADWRERNEAL